MHKPCWAGDEEDQCPINYPLVEKAARWVTRVAPPAESRREGYGKFAFELFF